MQDALPDARVRALMCSISSIMLRAKLVIIRACSRTLITVRLVRPQACAKP